MDGLTKAQKHHLDNAIDWLADAELGHLLTFMGAQATASAIGLTKGGLTYHFPSVDRLQELVVQRTMERFDDKENGWSYDQLAASVDRFLRGEQGDRDVAGAVAVQVGRFSPGHDTDRSVEQLRGERLSRPMAMLELLMVAAAPNDRRARDVMKQRTRLMRDKYVELIEPVIAGSGRRWRDPFTARSFSVLTQAVAEGFLYQRRIDSTVAPLDLYAKSWMALLAGCTYDPADPTDTEVDAFVAQIDRGTPAVATEVICDAAWVVVRNDGRENLRADRVARAAGVEVNSVYRIAPRRRDLHAVAFRGGVAAVARRAARYAEPDPGAVIGFLEVLYGFACDRPALLAAYLSASLSDEHIPNGPYDAHRHLCELLGRPSPDPMVEAAVVALLTIAKGGCTGTTAEAIDPVLPLLGVR
ncbi:hypothetical protein [Millisia brevis]|uniref:hypothetical protein n=1 Tax=Millisia brevis TaxID=264148 RepID=UPI00082ABAA8|nr:hypothetical protein [Millisia brevis]